MELEVVNMTPTRYREIQKYCPKDQVVLLVTKDRKAVLGGPIAAPPTPGIYVQEPGSTDRNQVLSFDRFKGYLYVPAPDWEAVATSAAILTQAVD